MQLSPDEWTWLVFSMLAVCAFAGHAIGKPKGRASQGVLFGLTLGIVGLAIIAALRPADEESGVAGNVFARVAREREVMEARLAAIDDMHRRGLISDEERAKARSEALAHVRPPPLP